jgi:hypothetical protein
MFAENKSLIDPMDVPAILFVMHMYKLLVDDSKRLHELLKV